MNPREITIDQVRNELETLIEQYPDRNGRVKLEGWDGQEDYSCVYFTDEYDKAINTVNYDSSNSETVVFKTPVCIVGQWVEDFHPYLKYYEPMRNILLQNTTLGVLPRANDTGLFNEDVLDLLSDVQSFQDSFGNTWKDIII